MNTTLNNPLVINTPLPKFHMTAYAWRQSEDARWEIFLDERFYNLKGSRGRGTRVASYRVYDRNKKVQNRKDQVVFEANTLRDARNYIRYILWAEGREVNTDTVITSD